MTRMDCTEVRDLLAPYHDEELPADERRAIADHLAQCAGCKADLATLAALSARVRAAGTHALPQSLEKRITDQLGAEDRQVAIRHRRWRLAASHVAAACMGALLLYATTGQYGAKENVLRDVLAAHTRALISDQLVQVASADTHTVRPWFASHVPFSPPVHNVRPDDFPLLGGRADVVLSRPAAVMVYGRRKHRINLFAQPTSATALPTTLETARNGYNVIAWRDTDFAYLAISDLNAAELKQFTMAVRASSP